MPLQYPLPDLCQHSNLLRVLVLAQALAIILSFAPNATAEPWTRLGGTSVFILWVTLCSLFVYCKLTRWLSQLAPLIIGLFCMAILLLFTFAMSAVCWLWLFQFSEITDSFSKFMLSNLLIAFVVGLIAIQLGIIHVERQVQLSGQSRAELAALQSRIQPHFLFNSLNTVAELIHQDSKSAEQALLDMADLFRAAMHAGETLHIEQEFALCRQYLSLEKWRLAERLEINWQLPPCLPDLIIPALTIQPLLENAVRHGIESCASGGVIDIRLICSNTSITLLISNPFVINASKSTGNGIALDNIRQRLQLVYAGAASLHHSVVDGNFRVKLVLPRLKSDIAV